MHVPSIFGMSVITVFVVLIIGMYIASTYPNNILTRTIVSRIPAV